jgi:DNA-binding MarR family transcriptional regulator
MSPDAPAWMASPAPDSRARAEYDHPVATDSQLRDLESVMLIIGRIGRELTEAIGSVGGVDLTGNAPIITLFALDLDGPKRPTDLQHVTGLTSGGVSKLLDRLEAAGLVTREWGAIAEDRRAAVVRLTSQGRRTAREIAGAIDERRESVRTLVAELSRLVDHNRV